MLLERFDGFAPLRNGLRRLAHDQEHWAGIPLPLEDVRLVIEPRYPHADGLSRMGKPEPESAPDDGLVIRNHWWSARLHANIYIFEQDGRFRFLVDPVPHLFGHSLRTLGCSVAWGIEQEAAAVQLLATLLSHHAFKMYLLTGMFLERSRRSGLTYLFRKLRPTVVLDARDQSAGETRILCALCLHPIAYYEASWAGAMTPTDDIVAHLMLMRADEPMFWRRANQHHPSRPEAGL